MENQHRKIVGYRELGEEEIQLMNNIKQIGIQLDELVNSLYENDNTDIRWISAAKLSLQTGLMQLTRAVAKPTTF